MKTFRRDKLRRLAEAGRLILVGSYHFDDMTGEHRSKGEMPVRLYDPRKGDKFSAGWCHCYPSDFNSGSGMAWEENGIVHLSVHGNSSYDFRVLPADQARPFKGD